jgi:hypothetical protein
MAAQQVRDEERGQDGGAEPDQPEGTGEAQVAQCRAVDQRIGVAGPQCLKDEKQGLDGFLRTISQESWLSTGVGGRLCKPFLVSSTERQVNTGKWQRCRTSWASFLWGGSPRARPSSGPGFPCRRGGH